MFREQWCDITDGRTEGRGITISQLFNHTLRDQTVWVIRTILIKKHIKIFVHLQRVDQELSKTTTTTPK